MVFSTHHSGNVKGSELEETHHIVTGVQKEIPTAPLDLRQKNKRRRTLQVIYNFAVKTPLRQLERARFCWPSNNWLRTVLQPNSTTTSRESRHCPKCPTTKMPTFKGKSEKFELFEDLFPTRLKFLNQLTGEDRINYFHYLMRGDTPQTFRNITCPNRENLGKNLAVFRRKHVKPLSMATTEQNFQRRGFNPANQKLIDFLDELQKLAKNAFGVAT